MIYYYQYFINNNNNNNIFLRSQLSHTKLWCMRLSCLWDKGLPLLTDFTDKVYGGIHTLTLSGFKLMKYKIQI
jgi:hypothetical protein